MTRKFCPVRYWFQPAVSLDYYWPTEVPLDFFFSFFFLSNLPNQCVSTFTEGFFRKILYTGVGLGGTAALCYPNATKDVMRQAVANAKELKKSAFPFSFFLFFFLKNSFFPFPTKLFHSQTVQIQIFPQKFPRLVDENGFFSSFLAVEAKTGSSFGTKRDEKWTEIRMGQRINK